MTRGLDPLRQRGLRQEHLTVHDIEEIKTDARGANQVYLNGNLLATYSAKYKEADLDMIRIGDIVTLVWDDNEEVVKRLADIGKALEEDSHDRGG